VWGEKIQHCSRIAQCHLQEGLRNAPSEFLQEAAVLPYAASGLQNILAGKLDGNVFSMVSVQALDQHDSASALKVGDTSVK
jgi:hypothetical protein